MNHIYNIKQSKQDIVVVLMSARPSVRARSLGPRLLLNKGNRTVLERHVEIINSTFDNPEILIISGFETAKIFPYIPKNSRIVDNSLYENTNGMEDVRLALLNLPRSKRVLFLSDSFLFNKRDLKEATKRSSIFCSDDEITDKSIVHENGMVENITLHHFPNSLYYGESFYLENKELEIAKKICLQNPFQAYMEWELLQRTIDNSGKFRAFCVSDLEFMV